MIHVAVVLDARAHYVIGGRNSDAIESASLVPEKHNKLMQRTQSANSMLLQVHTVVADL